MTSLSITVVGLLILAVVSYATDTPDTVRVTDPFQITPYLEGKGTLKDANLVPGRHSCGGTGRVLRALYDKCDADGSEICVISHDDNGRAEMVFVPSVSSRGLVFIFRIFATGTGGREPMTTALERQFPDVSFVAGEEYLVSAVIGPTPELKGKHVTTQWEVYRMADKQVEACSEQDFFVL